MLTQLNHTAQSILPFFKKGGRCGSWRLYIVTFGALIATMQGQDLLIGIGVPKIAVLWLVERATQITLAATFITMIKDHAKAVVTATNPA